MLTDQCTVCIHKQQLSALLSTPCAPQTDFAGLSDVSLCCTAQVQVHCLSGHDDTVASILTQATDPQVPPLLQHRHHALHSVTYYQGDSCGDASVQR
jgi:hypothetical protein